MIGRARRSPPTGAARPAAVAAWTRTLALARARPLAIVAAVAAAAAAALPACTVDEPVGRPLRQVLDVAPIDTRKVDVLLVVDPSTAMAARRQELIAQAEASFFAPLPADVDLHVAVTTTDVASPHLPAATCATPAGALRRGRAAAPCALVDGAFVTDAPLAGGGRGGNHRGALADAVACLADVDVADCPVAQPLAAARAALLAPGPEAQGFLREDALLVVAFVTDRDDCTPDAAAFFAPSELGADALAGRCFAASARCADATTTTGGKAGCVAADGAGLASIGAFADELRGLKADAAMVMVGGVFGPPGPVTLVGGADGTLVPASVCAAASSRVAAPGLRLAALAQALSTRYTFASICGNAADAQLHLGRDVARVLGHSACFVGPVPVGAPCRGYTEDRAGARTPLTTCGADGGDACFTVAGGGTCGDTESGLAAFPRRSIAGAHFVVECAAPDGL